MKTEKVTKAYHILLMTKRFNEMSRGVASEILRQPEISKRVDVIEKWAAVADICRCLHNFNGVLQICAAFTNSSVFRLKKTWEKVCKTVSASSLLLLLSPDPVSLGFAAAVLRVRSAPSTGKQSKRSARINRSALSVSLSLSHAAHLPRRSFLLMKKTPLNVLALSHLISCRRSSSPPVPFPLRLSTSHFPALTLSLSLAIATAPSSSPSLLPSSQQAVPSNDR